MSHSIPLKPRRGNVLRVLVVARISGCQNQKEISLEDQVEHAKQEIFELYDGETEFHVVATKGKGERLDRPELTEVEHRIKSEMDDVVFMEDVGRMVRGTAAVELWGLAVDRGIRCLAPNDGCDSTEATWEEDLIAACKDHVSHCAHTSRRIKHKQMTRFKRNGGALPLPVAGYLKPEGAKYYSDLRKDETAEKYIKQGLKILEETENWSAVADYFNQEGFPTGPYCKNDSWNGAMVNRLYHNPILKGRPQRGKKHSVKHNESGRRKSVVNPSGPTFRDEPHLAFFSAAKLDHVLEKIDQENERYRSRRTSSHNRGSRKRTRFPGRCAKCYYCGSDMVWGGNGMPHNLMCNGSRYYTCWNSFSFNGPLAAQRVTAAIIDELRSLQGFEAQYRSLVESHLSSMSVAPHDWDQLANDEAQIHREKDNLKSAIFKSGSSSLLSEWLSELEQRENDISKRRFQLELRSRDQPHLPQSPDELMNEFLKAANDLAVNSFEMADLLRRIISDFHVYLVQPRDGGLPVARGLITISLDGLFPNSRPEARLKQLLTKQVTVDLFEPPLRMKIREQCVKLADEKIQQREIAHALGTHQATVQHALKLDRIMRETGVQDPYSIVCSPKDLPPNRKFKRHLHDKYSFAMCDGYCPPSLQENLESDRDRPQ